MNVITRSLVLASAVNLALFGPAFSQENRSFNQLDDAAGWYFYNELEEPKEVPLEPALIVPLIAESNESKAKVKEDVVITSAWLRENLPKLQEEAQDNPTYANVRRYMYAQRIALDVSTKFAMVYGEVARREESLNESLRRPTSAMELSALSSEIRKAKDRVYAAVSGRVGILFFYASDCGYCEKMTPELERFSKRNKIEIQPISLDGLPLRGSTSFNETFIVDDGRLVEKMPVAITPTFYLVDKETGNTSAMAAGFQTSDKFEMSFFSTLRILEVITENQFQSTKQVKDILLADFSREDGKIKVNEEQVFEDPNYLSTKMKEIFQDKYLSGDKGDFSISNTVPITPRVAPIETKDKTVQK
ncbi:conjugal transfer protein TraF [Aliivibrio salmonicida]|uniref:conjugal transfer protein TraF n=1 Tax=Aliivibrio salmonicida TaxID=40269 RepID=UPI0013EB95AC|nr:conjugal transfer protein TraF [Aliivibrio salmonicida]